MSRRDNEASDDLPVYERPDVLLDPLADPGTAGLGASGAEASFDPSWPVLLRRRVADRAERSPRYRWWALSALLAGLLSLNITFTVFVVALPTVKSEFHTKFSVLTWASTGPLFTFGIAAPFFGKAGDLFGHRRTLLVRTLRRHGERRADRDRGQRWHAPLRPGPRRCPRGGDRHRLDGLDPPALFAPEERVKALGWWALVGAGGPVLGVTLGSPVIQYLGCATCFGVSCSS